MKKKKTTLCISHFPYHICGRRMRKKEASTHTREEKMRFKIRVYAIIPIQTRSSPYHRRLVLGVGISSTYRARSRVQDDNSVRHVLLFVIQAVAADLEAASISGAEASPDEISAAPARFTAPIVRSTMCWVGFECRHSNSSSETRAIATVAEYKIKVAKANT